MCSSTAMSIAGGAIILNEVSFATKKVMDANEVVTGENYIKDTLYGGDEDLYYTVEGLQGGAIASNFLWWQQVNSGQETSITSSGYYQDSNGKWHRPNGEFASNAEVGISSPVSISTGSHGNSLSDTRTSYGYALIDKDTKEILKFGETLYPETRYSQSYLEQNNAVMKILDVGSKEYIHYWQYDMNKYFEYRYDEFPRLNSKGW